MTAVAKSVAFLAVVSFVLGVIGFLALFNTQSHSADEAAVVLAVPITIFWVLPRILVLLLPAPTRLARFELPERYSDRSLVLIGATSMAMTTGFVLFVMALTLVFSTGVYLFIGVSWAISPAIEAAKWAFVMAILNLSLASLTVYMLPYAIRERGFARRIIFYLAGERFRKFERILVPGGWAS